jgi:hypothetical protein
LPYLSQAENTFDLAPFAEAEAKAADRDRRFPLPYPSKYGGNRRPAMTVKKQKIQTETPPTIVVDDD